MRPSDYQKALAREVIDQREFLGFTRQDLANRAGVTAPTIGNIERGDNLPSLTTILKIADALGLYPAEMLDAVEARILAD